VLFSRKGLDFCDENPTSRQSSCSCSVIYFIISSTALLTVIRFRAASRRNCSVTCRCCCKFVITMSITAVCVRDKSESVKSNSHKTRRKTEGRVKEIRQIEGDTNLKANLDLDLDVRCLNTVLTDHEEQSSSRQLRSIRFISAAKSNVSTIQTLWSVLRFSRFTRFILPVPIPQGALACATNRTQSMCSRKIGLRSAEKTT